MEPVRAFVGLGANLGDPAAQVREALRALAAAPGVRLVRASSLYRTAPVGHADQPDYVNAVAEMETRLPARELLELLLRIEQDHGRRRSFPDAPRTLDLDLLLYGEAVLGDASLTVPHPRLHERAFALAPLVEIAPRAVIPGHGPAAALLAACAGQPVERIGAP